MSKILLVEDDTNLSEIYQARLEAEGYIVVAATDGETALALAAKEKPDLILSDVMMPKISGFEMLDILRNTDGLKHTKVIMLTALGQAEDKTRAEQLGADRYLVKSQVTLEDIVTAARELLTQEDAIAATVATASSPDPVPAPAADPVPAAVATPEPVPAPVTAEPTQPAPTGPLETTVSTPAAATAPVAIDTTVTPQPVVTPTPIDTPAPVTTSPLAQPDAPATAPMPTAPAVQQVPVATDPSSSAAPVASEPTAAPAPEPAVASFDVPIAEVPVAVEASAPAPTPAPALIDTPDPAPTEPTPAPTVVDMPETPEPTPPAPEPIVSAPAAAIDENVVANAIDKLLAKTPGGSNTMTGGSGAVITPTQPAEKFRKKVISPPEHSASAPTLQELLAKEEAKNAGAAAPSAPTPAPAAPVPEPPKTAGFDPNSVAL